MLRGAASAGAQPVLLLLKHVTEVGIVTTTQLSKGVSRMARAPLLSLTTFRRHIYSLLLEDCAFFLTAGPLRRE